MWLDSSKRNEGKDKEYEKKNKHKSTEVNQTSGHHRDSCFQGAIQSTLDLIPRHKKNVVRHQFDVICFALQNPLYINEDFFSRIVTMDADNPAFVLLRVAC